MSPKIARLSSVVNLEVLAFFYKHVTRYYQSFRNSVTSLIHGVLEIITPTLGIYIISILHFVALVVLIAIIVAIILLQMKKKKHSQIHSMMQNRWPGPNGALVAAAKFNYRLHGLHPPGPAQALPAITHPAPNNVPVVELPSEPVASSAPLCITNGGKSNVNYNRDYKIYRWIVFIEMKTALDFIVGHSRDLYNCTSET